MKYLITGLLLIMMISCDSPYKHNNVNQPEQEQELEREDSIVIKTDTIAYPLDRTNYNEYEHNLIIHSYKDKNDVWFREKINGVMRVVYQPEKKTLLIYKDNVLNRKYINVYQLERNVKTTYQYDKYSKKYLWIPNDNPYEKIEFFKGGSDKCILLVTGDPTSGTLSVVFYPNDYHTYFFKSAFKLGR